MLDAETHLQKLPHSFDRLGLFLVVRHRREEDLSLQRDFVPFLSSFTMSCGTVLIATEKCFPGRESLSGRRVLPWVR